MNKYLQLRLFALSGLLLGLALGMLPFRLPQALPVTTDAANFSAGRAVRTAQIISAAPHPIGSQRQVEVRDAIMSRLKKAGYRPQLQQTVSTVPGANTAGRVENILARLPGLTEDDQAILVMAHYDSVPDGPGASDNASGAAVLLELARALQYRGMMLHDVIFLFTDGEEAGLLGAYAFLNHPWMKDVRLVINLDSAIGTPSALVEAGPQTGWLVGEYIKAAQDPLANSALSLIYNLLSYDTDLTPFLQRGVPGYAFLSIYASPQYHTARDTADTLDDKAIQHLGTQTLAMVGYFGWHELAPTETIDPVYFNLMGATLVSYPVTLVPLLTALLGLALAVLLVMGVKRKRLALKNMLAGGGAVLALTGLAGLLTAGLWQAAKWIQPALGGLSVSGQIYGGGWLAGGFALITIGLFFWLGGAAVRRWGLNALTATTQCIWFVLLLLLTWAAPGASYLAAWPLFGGLLALAWQVLSPESLDGPDAWGRAMAFTPAAIPVCVIPIPFLVIIFSASGMMAAPLLAMGWILCAASIFPLGFILATNASPRIGFVLVLAGLALTAVGLGSTGYSTQQPQAVTMQYWQDADAGQAWWLAKPGSANGWQTLLMGKTPVETELKDLLPPASDGTRLAAPAPMEKMPLPGVDALLVTDAGGWTLTAQLRADTAADALQIWLPGGLELTRITLGGAEMDLEKLGENPGKEGWLPLAFYAPGPDGVELVVQGRGTPPGKMHLWTIRYGLPTQPPGPEYMLVGSISAAGKEFKIPMK